MADIPIVQYVWKQRPLKQIQSDQTRLRIVEAATKLFARKGFYGTSIAALAEATGLTKGAFYHHFESKEAIFFAVVETVRALWARGVAREVARGKGALAQIETLLDSHTRLLSENEMLCLVMSNLMLEMEDLNPAYAKVLQQVYRDLTLFIERIVREGQKAAAIRSDLNPRLVAINIVAMLKGIGCSPALSRMGADRAALTGALKQVLIGGLRP